MVFVVFPCGLDSSLPVLREIAVSLCWLHLSVRGVQQKVSFLCLLQRSLLSFRENALCLFSLYLFVRGAQG